MKIYVTFAICTLLHVTSMYPQKLDDVGRWAAVAGYEIRVFPDGEKDPLAGPGIVYHRAGNIDLKLDVFTPGPETEVRPTVIYFHGGGWVHLRKEERAFYLLPYLARGMNAVNVEYRLANAAPAPAAVEDARCALHWVSLHAKQYGFDVKRLVVMGESAGAHLALMSGLLTANDGFDNACAWSLKSAPVNIAAIVNYFGPTDLADLLHSSAPPPWLIEWLGHGSNREDLAKLVSPLTYVRKGSPPTITIHGTNDGAVPYSQGVRLHKALDTVDVPNRLMTIQGGGHGQRNFSREENIRAQEAIFKFIQDHGVLKSDR